MASKLLLVIITFVIVGASLLSMRQRRLDTIHRSTERLERLEDLERRAWRMREDVARVSRPARLEESMLAQMRPWEYAPDLTELLSNTVEPILSPDDPRLHDESTAYQRDVRMASVTTMSQTPPDARPDDTPKATRETPPPPVTLDPDEEDHSPAETPESP